MDIEQLWDILYKERTMASLQELPSDFCEEVGEYMARLKAELEEADERRGELVEDEIRNARMKVEDIVRRRIGKLVKLASSGSRASPKGMLVEEQQIFEALRAHVDEGKERLLALMFGEREERIEEGQPRKQEQQPEHQPPEKGQEQPASWHMFKSTEQTAAPEGAEALQMVRILDDLPTFMGTDGRIYKVKREDVIMLPKTNAEILCNRGVAERFEGKRRSEEVTKR
jgi:DNA replication factor GINS